MYSFCQHRVYQIRITKSILSIRKVYKWVDNAMENFIRKRMDELGLSLSDVERELNLRGYKVTRAAIGHWASDNPKTMRKPPLKDPSFIEAFATALKVSDTELLEMAGLVRHASDTSKIANEIADIVKHLPIEQQKLALKLVKQLNN